MAGNVGGYIFPSDKVTASTPVSSSGQVTSGALGNNTVYSGNVASGQIGQFHLSSGSVSSFAVSSGAVLSGGIASGQIGWNALSAQIKSSTIESRSGIVNSGFLTPFTEKYHIGAVKGWVVWTSNAGGVSGTVAVINSYNVSSISDVSIGIFTVNWSSGFSTSGVSAVGMCSNDNIAQRCMNVGGSSVSASGLAVVTFVPPGTAADCTYNSVIAIGDLL